MIKLKKEFENHTVMLPNKVTINRHNVHLYEKIMKKQFPDMIEKYEQTEEKKVLLEEKSTPAESNG